MSDAAGIRAGRSFIELGANDAQLRAALDRAAARLRQYGQQIAVVGAKMAGLGLAGLAGLGVAANKFGDLGTRLERMSQRTGVSAEALSQLSYAATQTGTDLDTVEGAVKAVQQSLVQAAQGSAEAQDKFLMLGLRARDLARLAPEEQFLAIAEQLSKISNPAVQAARAMEIFGTTALLPMVQKGIAGVQGMRREANALGLTMSGQATKNALAFTQSLSRLQAVFSQLAVTIGGAMAPSLTRLANTLSPMVARFGEWIERNRELVGVLATGAASLAALGGSLIVVGGTLKLAGVALGTLRSGFAFLPSPITAVRVAFLALGTVVRSVLTMLASPLLLKAGLLFAAAGAARGVLSPRKDDAGASIGVKALNGIRDTTAEVFGGITNAATVAWDAVSSKAAVAWDSVRQTAVTAWDGISAAISAGRFDLAFEIMSVAMQLEWTKLTGYLKSSWFDFTEFVQRIWIDATSYIIGDWEGFTTSLGTYMDATGEVIMGVIGGIGEVFDYVAKAITSAWRYVIDSLNDTSTVLGRIVATISKITGASPEAIATAAAFGPVGLGAAAIGGQLASGRGLSDADPVQVQDQRRKRLDSLAAERAAEKEAREKEFANRKKALEDRLKGSVAEAKTATGKGLAGPAEDKAKKAVDGLGAFNRKVDVAGTFSAEAAGLLGGSTVMERIHSNGVQQVQKLDDIKAAIKKLEIPPAVKG